MKTEGQTGLLCRASLQPPEVARGKEGSSSRAIGEHGPDDTLILVSVSDMLLEQIPKNMEVTLELSNGNKLEEF